MLDFEKLHSLLDSPTEEIWLKNLYQLADSVGFNRVLYGVTPDRRLPLLSNVIVKSNYSPSWRKLYDNEGLVNVDPTVSHTLSQRTPVIWEPKIIELPKQQQLFEEAAGFGIKSGISYPIHGCNHEWGIMSFASDRTNDLKFNYDLNYAIPHLSLLRDYAYESGKKFFEKTNPYEADISLTNREVECLSWAMEGKSSWEIGMILGRAENTVNFHIKNVMSKLNVSSRQEALIKAIKLGFVQL